MASLNEARPAANHFACQATMLLYKQLHEHGLSIVDPQHGIGWRIKSAEAIEQKGPVRPYVAAPPTSHVNDFIGIRVLGLHLGCMEMLESELNIWANELGLREVKRENFFEKPRKGGYRAVHLDYQFESPEAWNLPEDATLEVQLTSWLQQLHSTLAHRMVYKTAGPINPVTASNLQNLSDQLHEIDKSISTWGL